MNWEGVNHETNETAEGVFGSEPDHPIEAIGSYISEYMEYSSSLRMSMKHIFGVCRSRKEQRCQHELFICQGEVFALVLGSDGSLTCKKRLEQDESILA